MAGPGPGGGRASAALIGIDTKALSDTNVVLVPGSHRMEFNPGGKQYYELTKQDRSAFLQKGLAQITIPVSAGTAVLMVGGKMVHGVPAVLPTDRARFTTYCRFEQRL